MAEGVRMSQTGTNGMRSAGVLDYAAILFTVVAWGGSFAAIKYALPQAGPLLVIWIRLLISIPVLYVGMYLENNVRLPRKREFWALLLMGLQGFLIHMLMQTYAMKTAGAANANWIMMITPVVVAILGFIFLKEKVSGSAVFGMFLSIAGMVLVLELGTVKQESSGGFGTMGDFLILLSMLNWAVYIILSRFFLKGDMTPSFILFWEILFSFIAATPTVWLLGADFSAIKTFSVNTWLALIFLGGLCSGYVYILWFQALEILPVASVAIFQLFQPIAGAVVSYFMVGERFTIWFCVGGALIMAGVWLVNQRQGHEQ